MAWPQVVMVAVLSAGLSRDFVLHGRSETIRADFTAFNIVILVALLWAGGFWS